MQQAALIDDQAVGDRLDRADLLEICVRAVDVAGVAGQLRGFDFAVATKRSAFASVTRSMPVERWR